VESAESEGFCAWREAGAFAARVVFEVFVEAGFRAAKIHLRFSSPRAAVRRGWQQGEYCAGSDEIFVS